MNRQEKSIIVFAISSLGIAIVMILWVLPNLMQSLESKASQFAGLVLNSSGEVKIRFGDSINWKQLKTSDKVYSNSYLFTGPDSSAGFGFVDESSLSLGPNSLVFIGLIKNKLDKDDSSENLQLELVNGKMQVDLKKLSNIRSLKVADAVIELNRKTSTILLQNDNEGMQVSVMQGDVKLTSKEGQYDIKSGEKLEVKAGETTEVNPLPPEVIEEMKKLSDEERKLLMEELQKNRNITSVIANILKRIFN